MNLPYIFMAVFATLGLMLHFGAIEQLGTITDPKTLRRIAIILFVLAFLSGLLNSTPTK